MPDAGKWIAYHERGAITPPAETRPALTMAADCPTEGPEPPPAPPKYPLVEVAHFDRSFWAYIADRFPGVMGMAA